jgi:PAS domain S-box-containing protein
MSTANKGYNILVIEDNPGDFALVEEFLLEQIDELSLLHAKTFQNAIEILSMDNQILDIVLLDLSLSDKTGAPLIEGIVDLCPNTPVIVLTGYGDAAFGIKSLALGISDYILKDDLTSTSLFKSIQYSLERKRAASALEESEKQYSELFHLSPQPMFVFELETLKFLDVNEAFIKHYGYTREELSLMDLREIRPAEEIPEFEIRLSRDTKDRKNNNSLGIYKHLKKNGEVIHVDIHSNFIRYKGKNAKITVATDVTERLSYIEAIEAQNEKLREISWIQSHMVRSPLARILGLVQLIIDLKINDDENGKLLDYLLLSANQLDDIIKEITGKTCIAEDNKFSKNYSRYILQAT